MGGEVQVGEDANQVRESVNHILAATKLVLVVEVGYIYDAFQVVRRGEPADNLVDLIADLFVTPKLYHVLETTACGKANRLQTYLAGPADESGPSGSGPARYA